MKKNYLLLALFALLFFSCMDDNIEPKKQLKPEYSDTFINIEEATTIASKFIDVQKATSSNTTDTFDVGSTGSYDLQLVYTDLDDSENDKNERQETNTMETDNNTKSSEHKPAYYVFSTGLRGYVIVSASKVTLPILGYSTTSSFDPNNIPPNMAEMLNGYEDEIRYTREQNFKVDDEILDQRSAYLDVNFASARSTSSNVIGPLLKNNKNQEIQWSQRFPYNLLCSKKEKANVPLGCVATATAQIMYYWRYPKKGVGEYSYTNIQSGKRHSFNYNYPIKWDLMEAQPNDKSSSETNNEIAKLCYGVAVGSNMEFLESNSRSTIDLALRALKYSYQYSLSAYYVKHDGNINDKWKQIILREIKAKRPVLYSGGDHAYVLDGYNKQNDMFHANWGWSGSYNGYFLLSSLNPIGKPRFDYSLQPRAVINLMPSNGTNYIFTVEYTDCTTQTYTTVEFQRDSRRKEIKRVLKITPGLPSNCNDLFKGCTALESIPSCLQTEHVSNMSSMFRDARKFNQDIGKWDVSNVKNMENMFTDAHSFNQDIGKWNVSNVSIMTEMFRNAKKFNQDIGKWDVSNVSHMIGMFKDALSFNQDIGKWNVSNVRDMIYMFCNAKKFNQDIGKWDVSSVIDMNNMFNGASLFNQDIGKWDVSNVSYMDRMFLNALSFNQDIGKWDVSKVSLMNEMFSHAKKFNQDIGKWNVSNVSRMRRMFDCAQSFNQDIGNWKVSSVYDMGGMFKNALSFNQDIGKWKVSNVYDMSEMFSNALSFNQNISHWDVSKVNSHNDFRIGSPLSAPNTPQKFR